MVDRVRNGDEADPAASPIRYSLGPLNTDDVTEKVIALITDDETYAKFAVDPLHYLAKEGIRRDGLSEPEIIDLVHQLRLRAAPQAPDNPQQIGATDQKKEKEKGTQWNFDHSKQYLAKVEANYWSERGRSSSTEKQELMQKDEGFKMKGKDVAGLRELLFDDDPDFHPPQPLVTPALFAKIRALQDKR
jgi:hypothetical protein